MHEGVVIAAVVSALEGCNEVAGRLEHHAGRPAIFDDVAPPDARRPYIVLGYVGDGPNNTFDRRGQDYALDVRLYAKREAPLTETRATLAAARRLLDQAVLPLDEGECEVCQVTGGARLDEPGSHARSITLLIRTKEAAHG